MHLYNKLWWWSPVVVRKNVLGLFPIYHNRITYIEVNGRQWPYYVGSMITYGRMISHASVGNPELARTDCENISIFFVIDGRFYEKSINAVGFYIKENMQIYVGMVSDTGNAANLGEADNG